MAQHVLDGLDRGEALECGAFRGPVEDEDRAEGRRARPLRRRNRNEVARRRRRGPQEVGRRQPARDQPAARARNRDAVVGRRARPVRQQAMQDARLARSRAARDRDRAIGAGHDDGGRMQDQQVPHPQNGRQSGGDQQSLHHLVVGARRGFDDDPSDSFAQVVRDARRCEQQATADIPVGATWARGGIDVRRPEADLDVRRTGGTAFERQGAGRFNVGFDGQIVAEIAGHDAPRPQPGQSSKARRTRRSRPSNRKVRCEADRIARPARGRTMP